MRIQDYAESSVSLFFSDMMICAGGPMRAGRGTRDDATAQAASFWHNDGAYAVHITYYVDSGFWLFAPSDIL